jgi:hypothetical protein
MNINNVEIMQFYFIIKSVSKMHIRKVFEYSSKESSYSQLNMTMFHGGRGGKKTIKRNKK